MVPSLLFRHNLWAYPKHESLLVKKVHLHSLVCNHPLIPHEELFQIYFTIPKYSMIMFTDLVVTEKSSNPQNILVILQEACSSLIDTFIVPNPSLKHQIMTIYMQTFCYILVTDANEVASDLGFW